MAGEITNVFVLMLENRSFDHMLGFSGIEGTDAKNGGRRIIDGVKDQTNSFNGQSYQVDHPAIEIMPVDPAHEFPDVLRQLCGVGASYPRGGPYPTINNSGFVADYAVSPSTADDEGNAPDDFGEIMKCHSPDQLPVLIKLANEFVVCDRWHASIPGPTWPNRFFAAAASSGGLDHSPSDLEMGKWESADGYEFRNGSIFDRLKAKFGDAGWRIYAGGTFPNVAALKGIHPVTDIHHFSHFASAVRNAPYPWRYTLIEPNYGNHTTFKGGTSQHPMDGVAPGEGLIKATYEAIRNSPLWPTSLLIITWDEHGGFYDHVEPPPAPPPGDTQVASEYNQYGFAFDRYGVRVPAIVISPLIPKNLIDHRLYDHSSIPKTLEEIFDLKPLTARDAGANGLKALLTETVRPDTPPTLPNPPPITAPQIAEATPDPTHPPDKSLPGFVHVAMRADIALNPAAKPAIVAQVQSIQTREQAAQYIQSVQGKVQAAKANATP